MKVSHTLQIAVTWSEELIPVTISLEAGTNWREQKRLLQWLQETGRKLEDEMRPVSLTL